MTADIHYLEAHARTTEKFTQYLMSPPRMRREYTCAVRMDFEEAIKSLGEGINEAFANGDRINANRLGELKGRVHEMIHDIDEWEGGRK